MDPSDNWCTQKGAELLCHKIVTYWRERGFKGIRAHIALVGKFENDTSAWGVRSNIINGFPSKI